MQASCLHLIMTHERSCSVCHARTALFNASGKLADCGAQLARQDVFYLLRAVACFVIQRTLSLVVLFFVLPAHCRFNLRPQPCHVDAGARETVGPRVRCPLRSFTTSHRCSRLYGREPALHRRGGAARPAAFAPFLCRHELEKRLCRRGHLDAAARPDRRTTNANTAAPATTKSAATPANARTHGTHKCLMRRHLGRARDTGDGQRTTGREAEAKSRRWQTASSKQP